MRIIIHAVLASPTHQRGQGLAEFLIGMPLALLLILGAFQDFGRPNARRQIELPNDALTYRDPQAGARSGESIQDANLLKVRVTYGAPLIVPLVNRLIVAWVSTVTPGLSPTERAYLAAGRLPIVAQAIVRLQTPALQSIAMTRGIPGAPNGGGNPGMGGGPGGGNGSSTPGSAGNGGNVPPIGPPGDSCPVLPTY